MGERGSRARSAPGGRGARGGGVACRTRPLPARTPLRRLRLHRCLRQPRGTSAPAGVRHLLPVPRAGEKPPPAPTPPAPSAAAGPHPPPAAPGAHVLPPQHHPGAAGSAGARPAPGQRAARGGRRASQPLALPHLPVSSPGRRVRSRPPPAGALPGPAGGQCRPRGCQCPRRQQLVPAGCPPRPGWRGSWACSRGSAWPAGRRRSWTSPRASRPAAKVGAPRDRGHPPPEPPTPLTAPSPPGLYCSQCCTTLSNVCCVCMGPLSYPDTGDEEM